MIYRVNLLEEPWKYLYGSIYDRLSSFKDEFDWSEDALLGFMLRLVANDQSCILLVALDGVTIVAHTLSEILVDSIFIAQVKVDTKIPNFEQECLQYLEGLVKDTPHITKFTAITTRNKARAYEKKYGFKTSHLTLYKEIKRE